MEIEENFKDKEITFRLRSDEKELIDNLSFVHLVLMKFDGEEERCESFQYPRNDEYIVVSISLPDWNATSNALAHCKQNTSRNGNVKESYKGALPNADPGNFMAEKLRERALSNKKR